MLSNINNSEFRCRSFRVVLGAVHLNCSSASCRTRPRRCGLFLTPPRLFVTILTMARRRSLLKPVRLLPTHQYCTVFLGKAARFWFHIVSRVEAGAGAARCRSVPQAANCAECAMNSSTRRELGSPCCYRSPQLATHASHKFVGGLRPNAALFLPSEETASQCEVPHIHLLDYNRLLHNLLLLQGKRR